MIKQAIRVTGKQLREWKRRKKHGDKK